MEEKEKELIIDKIETYLFNITAYCPACNYIMAVDNSEKEMYCCNFKFSAKIRACAHNHWLVYLR